MKLPWTGFALFVIALMVPASDNVLLQGQAPTVTLRVTDYVAKTPIPGVNVKVVDAKGMARDSGPTDGKGLFQTHKLTKGESITFEYALAGYVRNPERLPWQVKGSADYVEGTLLFRTESVDYLSRLAKIIDAIAAAASTPTAKQLHYTTEWGRIILLPPDSQKTVGQQLSGKQYLAHLPSFKEVMGTSVNPP